ncbi:hypothetical protein PUN28_016606 [Cardiocondyla obscurior]|uniref:Uncharacterized protein n=1 Tax=Cardiocondyla obscurior TaxID=286306 RepID=A0AAW2ERR0_9HYME
MFLIFVSVHTFHAISPFTCLCVGEVYYKSRKLFPCLS